MRSGADYRDLIPVCVISGRARKYPLNPVSFVLIRFRSPRVVCALGPISKSLIHDVEEVQETQSTLVGPIRANNVPTQERIGVVQVTSWHSCLPEEVLREECQVNSLEKQEEVCLPVMLGILTPSQLANPEVECCKDSKYGTHTQYIVEVRNYIIGIVQRYINSPVSEYDSCKSPNGEQYQESQPKLHGSSQPQRPSVKSPKPAENFNSSRNCNNHCSTCEICTSIYIQSYSIHVMPPHQESEYCNSSHSVNHSYIPEDRFTCKETQHVTNNSKCRLDLYIHFRVPEEPELMLVLHNISPTRRLEERSVEVTVSQKHSQSSCKYRKASNQLDTYKALCPNKQRYTVQGHSLSTHVCNSNQEVDGPLNTSNTRNVQAKNSQVYGSSGVTLCTTERGVRCPSYTRSLFYQRTQLQQGQSPREYPKGYVIHTGKCHIGCSDHNGHEPISETSHKRRHYNKKQHQLPVSSNQYVVKLPISCLNSRSGTPQLHTNKLTHGCCHYTSPAGKNKVQHTNVFGICTTKPSNKLIIVFIGRCFHIFCIFLYSINRMLITSSRI